MSLNDREQIHHQLLDALYTAKKQVEYLEAALAHNAAYLGTGVEREGKFGVKPEDMVAPHALIRYLELVEPEPDISDYIGSEGVDRTRPRLGPDAPASIRPNKQPPVDAQVGNVAMGHPDDILAFPFKAGVLPPGTYIDTHDHGENALAEAPDDLLPQASEAPAPDAPVLAGRKMSSQTGAAPPGQAAPLADKSAFAAGSLPMLVENVPAPRLRGQAQSPQPESGTSHAALLPPNGVLAGKSAKAPPNAEKDAQGGQSRPITDEDCLRAHSAMQALNYGLWDWNMRTGNVFISSRWEELLGKPPVDLPSALDTLTSGLHPEDAARLRASLGGLQNGRASSMNMPVRYGKGRGNDPDLWLDGRMYAACQRVGGRPGRLTVVFSEQAGQGRTDGLVSRAGLKAFFGGMEEGFALFKHHMKLDAAGQEQEAFSLLYMNAAFRGLCALDSGAEEELPLEAVAGNCHGEWSANLARVLREGRPVRMPLVSGMDQGLYEVSLFSPGPGRVACIAKNITEPHRLAQEVKRNEARLAALYRLSHMDDTNEDNMVRYCLGEAVRLTGSEFGYVYLASRPGDKGGHVYWSSDIQTCAGTDPASPRFDDAPWTAQAERPHLNGPEVVNAIEDVMAMAFGGSVAVNRYMLIPIMEDGRVLCVAAVANKPVNYEASDQRQLDLFINGMWFHLLRRRAVLDLQRAKEEAEAASRAKNEFLANISHEFRTPLNGILGMLQVLQKTELTKEQLECVRTATGSGRSLLRIIADILDFARMESGKLTLVRQPFDFTATVRSTLGLFSYEAERRNIDFSLSTGSGVPPLLVGDEARVRQIVFNLVGNAIKFTQHGKILVEFELLPYRKRGRYCIYLAVRDTGIGISPEKQSVIFQAFTQLDGSSTRRYAGAGIGLAIVGRLISLMDGSVTVESDPGEGTTIHCSLCFDPPPVMEPLPREGSRPLTPAAPLEILAVEDDLVNQFTLRTLLNKAGHNVICVANGRQAIEALLLRRFHCVITDIQMPIMDGGEFVRRIRESDTGDIEPEAEIFALLGMDGDKPFKKLDIPKNIPIVALTAHALAGDRERFLAMGLNYYLSKPLAASELESVLSRISSHVHALEQQQQP